MSDMADSDDGNAPEEEPSASALASAPTSTPRWTAAISISFFNALVAFLGSSDVATITEAELRVALIEHMLQQHEIVLDTSSVQPRLAAIKKYVDEFELQSQAFNDLHRRWEESRDRWLEAQRVRRQKRADRAARSRGGARPVDDSDDEFEIPEPLLPQTELQKAKVAAWSTFETVRQRWEAEKKHQRTAKREAGRIARLQQKRTERQRALLSTLSAVQRDDNVENVAMDDSSSSVSASSSSPTKRKFNAAAVVGVYTTYMTQAVIAQAQLAADLRQAMREETEATAAYRERKFKAEQDYRAEKLKVLRGDKENRPPNIP